MTHAIDTDLVAAASNLGPLIAEHSATGERDGRVPQVVLNALRDAGLFRLLVPRSLGGLETDPVTCARIIEEVSRFDSATGWTSQAENSGNWYCARLPDEGAEEICAHNPDTVISVSAHRPMPAVPIDGGYRVSGQNELASNIHDADWLLTFIALPDDTVGAVFISTSDVTIIDTWDSLGLRGTVRSAVETVDLIFGLAGKTGIYRRGPLERYFRDINTLRQHGFVSESRYQTVGQVLLGLEPDFPLAIFGPVADGE